jgi:hypothetical protein
LKYLALAFLLCTACLYFTAQAQVIVVDAGERALVTRSGEIIEDFGPGVHFNPHPFSSVYQFDPGRQDRHNLDETVHLSDGAECRFEGKLVTQIYELNTTWNWLNTEQPEALINTSQRLVRPEFDYWKDTLLQALSERASVTNPDDAEAGSLIEWIIQFKRSNTHQTAPDGTQLIDISDVLFSCASDEANERHQRPRFSIQELMNRNGPDLTNYGAAIQLGARIERAPPSNETQFYSGVEVGEPVELLLHDQRLASLTGVRADAWIDESLILRRYNLPSLSDQPRERVLQLASMFLQTCLRNVSGTLTSNQYSDLSAVENLSDRFDMCDTPAIIWSSIDFTGAQIRVREQSY